LAEITYIACTKCGKNKRSDREYFKLHDGSRYPMCKDCLTMYIDNRKPDTFKWILKKFDVPYIETKWVEITNKEYLKNPAKFGRKSVLGMYLRAMNMFQYVNYRYEDSDMLNNGEAKKVKELKQRLQERNENNVEYEQELLRQFEAGEISEAEYRTLSADPTLLDEELEKAFTGELHDDLSEYIIAKEEDAETQEEFAANDESSNGSEEANEAIAQAQEGIEKTNQALEEMSNRMQDDSSQLKDKIAMLEERLAAQSEILDTVIPDEDEEEEDPGFIPDVTTINEQDIQNDLTEEDIKYLSIKWGLLYKPSEWVKMEELYQKYAANYELSTDREQILKTICKTDLKMNQAIDIGDTKTFKDLQSANDQLRKSAKFTDSQKQEVKQRDLDSIGQLVGFVEKEGGIIPQYFDPIDTSGDKLDFIINDLKHYTDNLVKNELGLGNLIESYIKKLEEQKTQTAEDILKAGISDEEDHVTQEEAEAFQQFQIEEREEEAKRLAEEYGTS
jgi:hypothetical protein